MVIMLYEEEVVSCQDIQNAVIALQKHGINFLAIDFDLTLVDSKTEKENKADQVRVRKLFMEFVPCAMENGFHVAIVSFAKHLELIHDVLKSNFPQHHQHITVRSNLQDLPRRWHGSDSFSSKQSHIASAACEYNGIDGKISRKTTMLIDDEKNNIACALQDSVHALWFNPLKPTSVIEDILEIYGKA